MDESNVVVTEAWELESRFGTRILTEADELKFGQPGLKLAIWSLFHEQRFHTSQLIGELDGFDSGGNHGKMKCTFEGQEVDFFKDLI